MSKEYKRGKNKGQRGPNTRDGLGRLRRASEKPLTRINTWEKHSEDDAFLEQHGNERRNSHTGESLLAKFNRLTQDAEDTNGEKAVVCGFQGRFVNVRNESGEEFTCEIRRALTKKLQGVRNPVCIGDRVRYDKTPEGDPFVSALLHRDNQLARADSHNKSLLHVFAANIDYLIIVTALAAPEIRTTLIDRYLLIAHFNNIKPIVVINKCDLGKADAYAEIYKNLKYPVFCTSSTTDQHAESLVALREFIKGKQCVVAGQSGVGKSSLLNAMFSKLDIRVGEVSEMHQKGRHTTTSARSYPMANNTILIDTPGIRECAISEVTPLDAALLYPDIASFHHACKFNNCSHIHEPECAVKDAVEAGKIHPFRYESYLGIIQEDLAD